MQIDTVSMWSFLNDKQDELNLGSDDPITIGKMIAYLEVRGFVIQQESELDGEVNLVFEADPDEKTSESTEIISRSIG